MKPVQGSVGSRGDVLLKYECETSDGPMMMQFSQSAAAALKAYLDTPAKGMRSAGPVKLKP